MKIELKEIDRDSLKVGDGAGVARGIRYGYRTSFRHSKIIPTKINKVADIRLSLGSRLAEKERKYNGKI